MKKVLIALGILLGFIIAGSISAYYIYILPEYQNKQLAFEEQKYSQEQQDKRNKKLEEQEQEEKKQKSIEAYLKTIPNNNFSKSQPTIIPDSTDKTTLKNNNCFVYVNLAYSRIDDAMREANLIIDYWGTQFSKKYDTCVSIYFTVDKGEIEAGNFFAVDETKNNIINDSIFHVDSFYQNRSFEKKWDLTGKIYTQ